MFDQPTIAEALSGQTPVGTELVVRGWVRTVRFSKAGAGLAFINLSDGSGAAPIQVVATPDLPTYDSEVRHLNTGCSVEVEGTLAESLGKGQRFEVHATAVRVIGWVDDPDTYPVQPKAHSYEYLREIAHLRPRTNTFGSITRVRHTLAQAMHRFFDQHGFYWVNTPIITSNDAEGAGALFRVSTLDVTNLHNAGGQPVDYSQDFFGQSTYLTVSGQLNIEAYCLAMSRVYTFGPTFRAENSNTARHLAEFWMVEPEIAFSDLHADADLAEQFLKAIFSELLERRPDDMKFFVERVDPQAVARLEHVIASPFERIEYTEAIRALEGAVDRGVKFEFPVAWGLDLQSEHERYLSEQLVGGPVVVINYPKEIKAFYMRLNDDERTVAAMDVLAPGMGEIIGGSQREDRLDVFDHRLAQLGLDPEPYGWYRDLRRYGTVPHAGFGLGFERTIAYATGMANLRDVIPFPRTPRNARF